MRIHKKGITLVELLLALSLIGVMVVSISSVGNTLYGMKKDFLEKEGTVIKGHLAAATIFERVLRATAITAGSAFNISGDGTMVTYKRNTTEERIWLDKDSIKYFDGDVEKILLTGVKSLEFVKDFSNRLAFTITLENGKVIATAVQPRNEFTPGSVIN